MAIYKEDATKGRSILMPKSYKKDAIVQLWIDRRTIAILDKWLEGNGVTCAHLSSVVREALTQLRNALISSGSAEDMTTQEATERLERKFGVNLNPSERGKKNLLHNNILSELTKGTRKTDDLVEVALRAAKEVEEMKLRDGKEG